MATTTANATLDTAVLETFIPGYSLASRILATYFHLDLTTYLPTIILLSVLAATTKYTTRRVAYAFWDYFVSTAEISLEDEMATYLMFWMARQPFTARTTQFVAGTKLNTGRRYYYYDSDDEDSDADDENEADMSDGESFDEYWAKTVSRDKFKKLRFTPAQGTHYFRHKGRYFAFRRVREDSNGHSSWAPERLFVSCAGRDPGPIKELLLDAQRAYVARDGNRTVIYRGQKSPGEYWDWVRCMARPPRPLSTVVLDIAQKEAFVDDIKEYLHPGTRRWYSNRGIPYRRGYLLHGPPGTGKTSLCFAASGLLGLTLYLLNLNSKSLDEDNLTSLFQELPRRCIVLLEDVDSAGITKKREDDRTTGDNPSRENNGNGRNSKLGAPPIVTGPGAGGKKEDTDKDEEKPAGLSLSGLLNVIDGVAASEGRILVMTTNCVDKLDPALLRPGRVDMTITFGYTERADIRELFSAIYSPLEGDLASRKQRKALQNGNGTTTPSTPTTNGGATVTIPATPPPLPKTTTDALQKNQVRVSQSAEEFAAHVPAGEFTAAEIQGYLLNHKHEPVDAIEGVGEWVEEVRRKREGRK